MEEKVDKIQYPDILYILKNSQPIGNKRKLHQIDYFSKKFIANLLMNYNTL